MPPPYHHGSLRQALMEASITVILESGPAALNLRDLARRTGVSHGAPAYHFGDLTGLLTALAVEGHGRLTEQMEAALHDGGGFLEVGVAYVRFAVENRAHWEVMYRPDLLRPDDNALLQARARTDRAFGTGLAMVPAGQVGADPELAGVAAWSLMHGFAALWTQGALAPELGPDIEPVVRKVASLLFRDNTSGGV
jgi:AcrR family transcriptional regulator